METVVTPEHQHCIVVMGRAFVAVQDSPQACVRKADAGQVGLDHFAPGGNLSFRTSDHACMFHYRFHLATAKIAEAFRAIR